LWHFRGILIKNKEEQGSRELILDRKIKKNLEVAEIKTTTYKQQIMFIFVLEKFSTYFFFKESKSQILKGFLEKQFGNF
jgi:hypothetical protein